MRTGHSAALTALSLRSVPAIGGCAQGSGFPTGAWQRAGGGDFLLVGFQERGRYVVVGGASSLQPRQLSAGTRQASGDQLRLSTDSLCRAWGSRTLRPTVGTRDQGDRRPDAEPHLGQAPPVRGFSRGTRIDQMRLVRLERDRPRAVRAVGHPRLAPARRRAALRTRRGKVRDARFAKRIPRKTDMTSSVFPSKLANS